MLMEKQMDIFSDPNGKIQIEVQFEGETFWLNMNQIARLFEKDKSVISRHMRNIFAEGELDRNSTVAKNATVQVESGRQVKRELEFYNLDAILSVGYRVNSKRGTQFRQWATQRLKDYLVEGVAINETRLAQRDKELKVLHDGIRILSRVIEEKVGELQNFDWLQHFNIGLQLLDDYDHDALDDNGKHIQQAEYPSKTDYEVVVHQMRKEIQSGFFGMIKDGGFESAIYQIKQGHLEVDFYRSIEEKAAMLLYLIVKNHAFVDGNKRIAAACFLLFLSRNGILYTSQNKTVISNEALASLTLFVAASKPEEMETVKRLIVSVLNRNLE
jgi:death-on-curing family protein